jgi:hypothetical protein
MPSEDPDRGLIELERRLYRKRLAFLVPILLLGMVGGAAAGAVMILARRGVLPLSPHLATAAGLAVMLLIILPGAALSWRLRPPREAMSEGVVRKRMDDLQARAVRGLIIPVVLMPLQVWLAYRGAGSRDAPMLGPIFFCGVVGLYVTLFFMGPLGDARVRRLVDDELSRAHRAAALKLTYPVIMAVFALAYLGCLYAPDHARLILPVALAIGAVAPIGAYGFAQWRAELGG